MKMRDSIEQLYLGASKCCITPQHYVRMAGFADRKEVFEKIKEDIYLRVLYLRQGDISVLVISADLIWWGESLAAELQNIISVKTGIPKEHIILTATHNHSGPPTCSDYLSCLETYDHNYAVELKDITLYGIRQAMARTQVVSIEHYVGDCNLNVYRRKRVDGTTIMAPNYKAPVEKSVDIYAFVNEQQQKIAQMIRYSCHANVAGTNELHPDFAGMAMNMLEAQEEHLISLYLQGSTADIRPNIALGDRFLRGDYAQAKSFATQFAERVSQIMEEPASIIAPDFNVATFELDLPLTGRLVKDELEEISQRSSGKIISDNFLQGEMKELDPDAIKADWAQKVLQKNNPRTTKLTMTAWRFNRKNGLVFFNCEPVQSYDDYTRLFAPGFKLVGYTNGMFGYLCTTKQYFEGGYEPHESWRYFALSGMIDPCVEYLVATKLKKLTQKVIED